MIIKLKKGTNELLNKLTEIIIDLDPSKAEIDLYKQ